MSTLRSQLPEEAGPMSKFTDRRNWPSQFSQLSALPPPQRQQGLQQHRPETGRKFACHFYPLRCYMASPKRPCPMFYSSLLPFKHLTPFQINIFQGDNLPVPVPPTPCLRLRDERKHKTSCDGLKIECWQV